MVTFRPGDKANELCMAVSEAPAPGKPELTLDERIDCYEQLMVAAFRTAHQLRNPLSKVRRATDEQPVEAVLGEFLRGMAKDP
jgi:hypothetical protein